MLNSCITRTKMVRLWQSTLHKASFICPTSLLLRKESPNLPLMAAKADSAFDLLW